MVTTRLIRRPCPNELILCSREVLGDVVGEERGSASSFTKNKSFVFVTCSSMHFDLHIFFMFFFFFLNQAKFTLTFNHYGLTRHQATVDVSKLKTFQLQQKILKP